MKRLEQVCLVRRFCSFVAAAMFVGSASGCGYRYFQWRGAPEHAVAAPNNQNAEPYLPRDRKGQVDTSDMPRDYLRDFRTTSP